MIDDVCMCVCETIAVDGQHALSYYITPVTPASHHTDTTHLVGWQGAVDGRNSQNSAENYEIRE